MQHWNSRCFCSIWCDSRAHFQNAIPAGLSLSLYMTHSNPSLMNPCRLGNDVQRQVILMDLQALSQINLSEVELICILIVYKPRKSRFGKLKVDEYATLYYSWKAVNIEKNQGPIFIENRCQLGKCCSFYSPLFRAPKSKKLNYSFRLKYKRGVWGFLPSYAWYAHCSFSLASLVCRQLAESSDPIIL